MSEPRFSFPDQALVRLLQTSLDRLSAGFGDLPHLNTGESIQPEVIQSVLNQVADRLVDNYPYFHPLYAGQMLKPPHPVARLAYSLAMWINPNNHALDGGKASSAMEKEAVAHLAEMFGWETHLGHLCGGGTMANLEALWVAGRLNPGKTIVASEQAHYTHHRICGVLGIPFESVPCDSKGRMNLSVLREKLATGKVGTVVATMGTTAIGSVDPLAEILELRPEFDFRVHADAAYGGYYGLAKNLAGDARRAFDQLNKVDSLVIDPHKHGLQPYGCGCVLFRDRNVGWLYRHDSPYTYFSSDELHLGEISLECSRPGAAAVALWATHQHFPLVRGGTFASQLAKSRTAALTLFQKLNADSRFLTAFEPELDIVVWIPKARNAYQVSALSRQIFAETARQGLHLALADLPVEFFNLEAAGIEIDQPHVTVLRSVLMKPEHLDWIEDIWRLLDQATTKCRSNQAFVSHQ
ncbi:MAG: aspartate aminotransferase family protein [Acidobacteria bacterium]|nr:aspartate aminotransferase family protein [Acidobacteriota bacterium]